jgi:hypothetical protein
MEPRSFDATARMLASFLARTKMVKIHDTPSFIETHRRGKELDANFTNFHE